MRPHPNPMMVGGPVHAFAVRCVPDFMGTNGPYTGSPIVTALVTAEQTYGPASALTYSWAQIVGYGVGTITIDFPTSSSTSFRGTPGQGTFITRHFRCTVTNSFGNVAFADVDVMIKSVDTPQLSVPITPAGGIAGIHMHPGEPWSGTYTATPSGGNGSYTYSWHGAAGCTVSPTNVAVTVGSYPGQSAGTTAVIAVTCHVVDSAGVSGDGIETIYLLWDL